MSIMISRPAVKVTAKKRFQFENNGLYKGEIGLEHLGSNKASYFALSGIFYEKRGTRWIESAGGQVFREKHMQNIARAIGRPLSEVSEFEEARDMNIWPADTPRQSVPVENMAFFLLSHFLDYDQFGRNNEDKGGKYKNAIERFDKFAVSRSLGKLTDMFKKVANSTDLKDIEAEHREDLKSALGTTKAALKANLSPIEKAVNSGTFADVQAVALLELAKVPYIIWKAEETYREQCWKRLYKNLQSEIADSPLCAHLHTFAHEVAQKWL